MLPTFRYLVAALLLLPAIAGAELRLGIPPIFDEAEVKANFQPLAEYLSLYTGDEVTLVTAPNYLAYWQKTLAGGNYDLVLDNAALTDFRARRQNFKVICRVDGRLSQSLVTREDTLVFEPRELLGKKMATLPSPSLSALVVHDLFDDPIRRPRLIEQRNSLDAIAALRRGETEAALVPSPIAAGFRDLNVVLTTPQLPHLALSAAPGVSDETLENMRMALVSAASHANGRAMLEAVNIPGFVAADSNEYAGQASLLEGTYGYRP